MTKSELQAHISTFLQANAQANGPRFAVISMLEAIHDEVDKIDSMSDRRFIFWTSLRNRIKDLINWTWET